MGSRASLRVMHSTELEFSGPYGNVPALAVAVRPSKRRGTVLMFHGLHEAKERYRDTLHALAGQGFLAVGIDSIAHGARRARDFDAQVARGFPTILRWVEETTHEVPGVLDALEALCGGNLGRVGVCGVSMGGYIAYALGVREPRVSAVVSILGSPEWPAGPSPHLSAHAFAPRPLLAINCELDSSVPPEPARRFVEMLRPRYADCPGNLEYVEYPKWGHLLSDGHWADTWKRTSAWFDAHLG